MDQEPTKSSPTPMPMPMPAKETTREAPERLPFDRAAAREAREALRALLNRHPELRSVAVVFDWQGGLNAAGAVFAEWQSAAGEAPGRPDELFGLHHQVLRLSERLLGLERRTRETLAQQVAVLGRDVVRQAGQEPGGGDVANAQDAPSGQGTADG